MGEARGGDGRPADTGRTERVRMPQRADAETDAPVTPAAPEKAGGAGRLDLSVPQVAGSAVAAVVAAKLASNLGVYGTIVGAGVVSVLGTCGGSILQHFFRRTGRQVQEVAVQARPGVRRVREQVWTRPDAAADRTDRTRVVPEAGATGTGPLTSPATSAGPLSDTGTGEVPGTDADAAPGSDVDADADAGQGGGDGYGEAASYRAGKRGWKRPVVAVALAFGLTMGGITGYEAIAGENISGGHGTTIGNAVNGRNSPHSGGTEHTPAPGSTDSPTDGTTTGPHGDGGDGNGRPGQDPTPSSPRPSDPAPSTGTGGSGGSGGSGQPTPPPTTSPAPT
uniref:hypothetical protein n=1 Tax=Streptomyces sp. IBSBF 2435 TaxID=2903531 RepID=UPI002FDBF155